MQLKQVSDNCFAVLNEKNRVCDATIIRVPKERVPDTTENPP